MLFFGVERNKKYKFQNVLNQKLESYKTTIIFSLISYPNWKICVNKKEQFYSFKLIVFMLFSFPFIASFTLLVMFIWLFTFFTFSTLTFTVGVRHRVFFSRIRSEASLMVGSIICWKNPAKKKSRTITLNRPHPRPVEWPPLITKCYLNNLVTLYSWFDLKILFYFFQSPKYIFTYYAQRNVVLKEMTPWKYLLCLYKIKVFFFSIEMQLKGQVHVYYRGLTQAVFLHLRLRHATLNISKNNLWHNSAVCLMLPHS